MPTRILFVDDEPLLLQALARRLRAERPEWHAEFLTSGQAALARLQDTKFDVVVSDWKMPAMDGQQLLRQITERHPQILPILLTGADRLETGRATSDNATRGARLRCLSKTSPLSAVLDAIHESLQHARRDESAAAH